jgi:hypothetical protein
MKKIFYFVLPFLALFTSFFWGGCDAAEDFAEEQSLSFDTTIVMIDTVRNHTDVNFIPVKFELEIQLGSFTSKKYADILSAKADSVLNKKSEVIYENNIYRVSAERFTNPEKANAYLEYVKGKGFRDAFVKKIRIIDGN